LSPETDTVNGPLFVDGFDLLDQRLRLVVVDQRKRDDRGVAVPRDERFAAAGEIRTRASKRCDLVVGDEVPHVGLEPW
jgi:hypothetical protein